MKRLIWFAPVVVLVGCGGGGGGGGSGSAGVTPFSTWSAITPNSTVRVDGNSQEVSYTANSSTDRVTSVSSVSPNQDGAYYQSSYGSDGRANAVDLRSAKGTTVSWSTAKGDTIARIASGPYAGINAAISAGEGANAGLSAEPLLNGWNYQSFGVWITGRGQGSGTAGAMSVGNPTAVNTMPQSGTATYSGSTGGIYLGPAGEYFLTTSNMSANVNFGSRQISFATSGTVGATPNMVLGGNSPVSVPALNISGLLAYSADSTQFSGVVKSAGGANANQMSGTAVGKFYGPSAREIGGTFSMKGSGMETFAGAFGGKR